MKKPLIKNRSGQSLVSIIVAAGIGAIVLGFIGDMMFQQGLGQKFLTQKLEINDLTNNLISTFSKAGVCGCQFADDVNTNPNFANFAGLHFDSTITDGTQKISVKKLYSSCKTPTNTPLVIVEDGVKLSSSGLTVDKVELVNLRPTGGPNEWQGQWQISFLVGNGSVMRSVKPIIVSQKMTVNIGAPYSATSAVISACSGISSGSGTVDFLAKWTLTPGLLQNSGVFEDPATNYVGIGTTNPNSRLQVSNNSANVGIWGEWPFIAIQNTNATAGNLSQIGFLDSNSLLVASISAVMAQTTQDGELQFGVVKAGVGNNALRINKDGNVGIGTTNPLDIVHVEKNQNASTMLRVTNSTAGAYSGFVLGQNPASGDSGQLFYANTGNAAWPDSSTILQASGAGGLVLSSSSPAHLRLYTNNTERMRIESVSGNVGIGTTLPTAKLHVGGNAGVDGIRFPDGSLQTSAWGSGAVEYVTCQYIAGLNVNTSACTANCTGGRKVIGGGCNSDGSSSNDRTYPYRNSPTAGNLGWICAVTLDAALPSNAQTVANGTAICIL